MTNTSIAIMSFEKEFRNIFCSQPIQASVSSLQIAFQSFEKSQQIEPIFGHYKTDFNESEKNDAFIEIFVASWMNFSEKMETIKHNFQYLDTVFQLLGKETIWRLGLCEFRKQVLCSHEIHKKNLFGILDSIEKQRDGELRNGEALREILQIYIKLALYEPIEKSLKFTTSNYYEIKSDIYFPKLNVYEYLQYAKERIKFETNHIAAYLHPRTKDSLIKRVESILIKRHAKSIWEKTGLLHSFIDPIIEQQIDFIYEQFVTMPLELLNCLNKVKNEIDAIFEEDEDDDDLHIVIKEIFRTLYMTDLVARLCYEKTYDFELERSLATRLLNAMEPEFSSNLDVMLSNIKISKKINNTYSNYTSNVPFLYVTILTQENWPKYVTSLTLNAKLPPNLEQVKTAFERVYKTDPENKNKKLKWQYGLDRCIVEMTFEPKNILIDLSLCSTLVLLLFNNVKNGSYLSYKEIKVQTELGTNELNRALQSLIFGKVPLLSKDPPHDDIESTNKFCVNESLDTIICVDDGIIMLEDLEVTKRVQDALDVKITQRLAEDRAIQLDSAIMRIIKPEKKIFKTLLIKRILQIPKFEWAKEKDVQLQINKLEIDKFVETDKGNRVEFEKSISSTDLDFLYYSTVSLPRGIFALITREMPLGLVFELLVFIVLLAIFLRSDLITSTSKSMTSFSTISYPENIDIRTARDLKSLSEPHNAPHEK
ncbi:4859_t:CDS:10 [Scutellospora calospora]|uniref:4859_t:CDS:1 n=1 Tax=Scutellospora calospora TaxID=85575 RepID=A0ACA9KJD0_9GLOM|nr:4859_t:CDS:10 [Scutellospora calospora]